MFEITASQYRAILESDEGADGDAVYVTAAQLESSEVQIPEGRTVYVITEDEDEGLCEDPRCPNAWAVHDYHQISY